MIFGQERAYAALENGQRAARGRPYATRKSVLVH